MGEALHHQPQSEADLPPPIPLRRRRGSAEVIDFSKASVEYVTGLFMTELRHPSRKGLQGHQLASFIEAEMSADQSEEPTTLRSRLSRITDSDPFGNDEVYDHKVDHDPVFHDLIERLQTTKKASELRDQRKAALKLAELRAAVPGDETADDETWHDVIDRLFR